MLKSLDEIKAVELEIGNIENGVDNPNLMSVDSTSVIRTSPDEIKSEGEKIAEAVDASGEKKKAEEAAAAKAKADADAKIKADAEAKEKADAEAKAKAEAEGKEKPAETKDAVQKRIDELTKHRRTAERERDFEKKKRLELEEEVKKLKAAIPAKDKPKKEDFPDDDEGYLEALADWKVEQKLKTKEAEVAKAEKDEEIQANISEADEHLDNVMEKGRTKYKDFNQLTLDEKLVMSPLMLGMALESDNAEEIIYYFGKNPEESAAIAKMSPRKAAKAIEEIEAKIATPPTERKEEKKVDEPKKKVSNAPEPIKSIGTGAPGEKDPSTMTPKEYRAWREKNKG